VGLRRPAWNEVLLRAARAIVDRQYQTAFDQLSDFLQDAESQEERREALAMRATVLTHLSDLESAQRDLEMAHSLSRSGEYPRYTIELLLARVARDRGDFNSMRRLYFQALKTALDGGDFSAGTALEGVMGILRTAGASDAEHDLIRAAISASRRVLGIDAPMPDQLEDAVQEIRRTECRK
jgi:tetratricopeptide (TPR) repeat protein